MDASSKVRSQKGSRSHEAQSRGESSSLKRGETTLSSLQQQQMGAVGQHDALRSLAPSDMDLLELEEEVDYEDEPSTRLDSFLPRTSSLPRPNTATASRGAKSREREEKLKREAKSKRKADERGKDREERSSDARERRRGEKAPKQPISWRAWKEPHSSEDCRRGGSRDRSRSREKDSYPSHWNDRSRSPPPYRRRSPPYQGADNIRRTRSTDPFLLRRFDRRFPSHVLHRDLPRVFGSRRSPPWPFHRPQEYFPHRRGERREQDYLASRKEPAYSSPAWEEWNRLREFELRLLRKEQELQEREEERRQASGAEVDRPLRGEQAEQLLHESEDADRFGGALISPLRRTRSQPEEIPWSSRDARSPRGKNPPREESQARGSPAQQQFRQPAETKADDKDEGKATKDEKAPKAKHAVKAESPRQAAKRGPESSKKGSSKRRKEGDSGEHKKPSGKVGSKAKADNGGREGADANARVVSLPKAEGDDAMSNGKGGPSTKSHAKQSHSMELRARAGEPAQNSSPKLRVLTAPRAGQQGLPLPPPPPLSKARTGISNDGDQGLPDEAILPMPPSLIPDSPLGKGFDTVHMRLRSGSQAEGVLPESRTAEAGPLAAIGFRPQLRERFPQTGRGWSGGNRRRVEDKVSEWYYKDPQGVVQGPASKFQLRQWLTQLANANDRMRHRLFCNVRVWRDGGSPTDGIPLLQLLNNR